MKQFQTDINGVDILITSWPWIKQQELLIEYVRPLLKVGSHFVGALDDKEGFELSELGGALEKMASELSFKEYRKYLIAMLSNVTFTVGEGDDRERIEFSTEYKKDPSCAFLDNVLGENITLQFKVIQKVLEVNYPNLFGLVQGADSIKGKLMNLFNAPKHKKS